MFSWNVELMIVNTPLSCLMAPPAQARLLDTLAQAAAHRAMTFLQGRCEVQHLQQLLARAAQHESATSQHVGDSITPPDASLPLASFLMKMDAATEACESAPPVTKIAPPSIARLCAIVEFLHSSCAHDVHLQVSDKFLPFIQCEQDCCAWGSSLDISSNASPYCSTMP